MYYGIGMNPIDGQMNSLRRLGQGRPVKYEGRNMGDEEAANNGERGPMGWTTKTCRAR